MTPSLFVVILALSAPPFSQQMQLKDIGFLLEFPTPWTVRNETAGHMAAVAELPPRQAIAMLSRTPMEDGDSERRVTDQMIKGLKSSFEKHEILKNEPKLLPNGMRARVVVVRGFARGSTIRHLTYLFSGYGVRLNLTFATPEEKYASLEASFEALATTMKMNGPNPLDAALFTAAPPNKLDLKKLKSLLDKGADINALDANSMTLLSHAIFHKDGPFTKWLLEKGADPKASPKTASMLSIIATPPIRALLASYDPAKERRNPKPSSTPLKIEWTSKEAQLFAGIKSIRIQDVREALEKGVDLSTQEPGYQLPALPLVRKIIEEYRELELDPVDLLPIEALIADAVVRQKSKP